MQKRGWILIGIVIAAVIIAAVIIGNNQSSQQKEQLPNPASVYCEQQGGNVVIKTDASGGQYGICMLKDGGECEEWSYFRGECGCSIDSDCVPDACCHASGCIAKTAAPSCSGVLCSQECVPGTLDCGQGSCKCINGVCGASLNG